MIRPRLVVVPALAGLGLVVCMLVSAYAADPEQNPSVGPRVLDGDKKPSSGEQPNKPASGGGAKIAKQPGTDTPRDASSDKKDKKDKKDKTKPAVEPDNKGKNPGPDADAPVDVAQLKALQDQVHRVLAKAMPTTVGILIEQKGGGGKMGMSSGSGVIISEDGYVLTAGHVSGKPGESCWVILPDGKRVKGKTLGRNKGIDSGLIQIQEKRKWAFSPMGDSTKLKVGQWCVTLGHPGGFKTGRSAPVRLGRVLMVSRDLIQTDCTLVGGDSGGPLFDLDGKVIGIHSRISRPITANIHVPVNTYRDTWARLIDSEDWGGGFLDFFGGKRAGAYLGIGFDRDKEDLTVTEVKDGQAAAKAGIKVGDTLLKIDGTAINRRPDLTTYLLKKKPGQEIEVEVDRDGKKLKIKVTLGRRPE